MEENKNENVVEEITQENPVKEEPKVDDKVEKLKVKEKPKMKKLNQQNDDIIKVDLSKPPKIEDNTSEEEKTEETEKTEEVEKIKEDVETPIVEEVTDEKEEKKIDPVVENDVIEMKEDLKQAATELEEKGTPIPENVQKLIDFMSETGGNISDYVKLNRDYSKLDDVALLREYYGQTKPHLNSDEIDFMMEDMFHYDEEEDDQTDVKRKKLALKEQVASAKTHLDGLKSKYYEDIKARSTLSEEQQKAVDFFDRYNVESEENEKAAQNMQKVFTEETDKVFTKFKGFEYNIGDKRFRYNVSNADEVKQTQSDVNNFVGKFLDESYTMKDAAGYHKALYTAMNADAIANHFYEQGKADAIKDSVAKAKNVNMKPRESHGVVEAGGIKVRVLGEDSSDFKFKIKNRK